MKLKSLIGDRAFYKKTLAIAIPMMIQNAIGNLVSLIDNVMVGALGTEQMSGVSIVNQFVFVFSLAVFGAVSGAGLFTAQYAGRGDTDGVRYTFRAKMIINLVIGVLGVLIFCLFGTELISTFLHKGTEGDLELTLAEGEKYLLHILVGLLPFVISQVYASTLRETGETVLPMVASVASVVTNLIFNTILIFGLLGAPALGVVGAAIATSISRFVELFILLVYSHTHTKKFTFLIGAFNSLRVPLSLAKQIAAKGLPILANEFFWSLSMTVKNQCLSTRGLGFVAAFNIAITIQNLVSVSYFALSSSVGIMVGHLLGAGEIEEAKDTDKKLLAFSAAMGTIMMLVQLAIAPFFPLVYNTTPEVRKMATVIMVISAFSMPIAAFFTSCYYTVRSGGNVLITLLLDSVYNWVLLVPTAALLAHFTDLSIYPLFILVLLVDMFKLIPSYLIVKRGKWARQLKVE